MAGMQHPPNMERVEECRKEVGAEMAVMDGCCLPAPGAAPAGYEGWAEGSPGSVQAACGEKILNISLFTFLWVACSFLPM